MEEAPPRWDAQRSRPLNRRSTWFKSIYGAIPHLPVPASVSSAQSRAGVARRTTRRRKARPHGTPRTSSSDINTTHTRATGRARPIDAPGVRPPVRASSPARPSVRSPTRLPARPPVRPSVRARVVGRRAATRGNVPDLTRFAATIIVVVPVASSLISSPSSARASGRRAHARQYSRDMSLGGLIITHAGNLNFDVNDVAGTAARTAV